MWSSKSSHVWPKPTSLLVVVVATSIGRDVAWRMTSLLILHRQPLPSVPKGGRPLPEEDLRRRGPAPAPPAQLLNSHGEAGSVEGGR